MISKHQAWFIFSGSRKPKKFENYCLLLTYELKIILNWCVWQIVLYQQVTNIVKHDRSFNIQNSKIHKFSSTSTKMAVG